MPEAKTAVATNSMREKLHRLKDKGKEHLKKHGLGFPNGVEPKPLSLDPSHSEHSSVPGSLNDHQISPEGTVVANHDLHVRNLHTPEYAVKAVSQSTNPEDGLQLTPTKRQSTITPYGELRNDITREMNSNRIGFMDVPYFPDKGLSDFVTDKRVKAVFPDVSDDLVSYITRDAKKTFLITVLTMKNIGDGFLAMTAFHHHDFKDSTCLPVKRSSSPNTEDHYQTCTLDWGLDDRCCSDCESVDISKPVPPVCEHGPELDAFHHRCWDNTTYDLFFEKQWNFQLQVFNIWDFQYDDLEDERILPFILDAEMLDKNKGNFSEVQKAWMLASHLEQSLDPAAEHVLPDPGQSSLALVQTETGTGKILVAIKTLKPLSQVHYNIYNEWKREAAAHRALNKKQHAHIVKGLAAFRQRNRHHLILEWANGGNLRTFWRDNPKPTITRKLVRELLQQLFGLADALHCMHNTKRLKAPRSLQSRRGSHASRASQPERARDTTQSDPVADKHVAGETTTQSNMPLPVPTFRFDAPTAESPYAAPDPSVNRIENDQADDEREQLTDDTQSDIGREENWRHGDIKPDNILRFVDSKKEVLKPGAEDDKAPPTFGTLKLADLGRAKRHVNVTIDRGDIEVDRWHTKNYEPPDIFIHKNSRTTSRLYDIWSLGCVFFEAVVWLLYGRTELTNYHITTDKFGGEGSPYWTRSGPGGIAASVSHMAALWMETILKRDPECSGPDNSAIRDLMLLIRDKMLVVDLPARSDEDEPNCRANSKSVLDELQRILNQAMRDDKYLFTRRSRDGVKAPSYGLQVGRLNVKDSRQSASGDASNSINVKDFASGLVPAKSNVGVTTAMRQSQYTNLLSDAWEYEDDDEFSNAILEKVIDDHDELFPKFKKPKTLCKICSSFDPLVEGSFGKHLRKELVEPARKCRFCKLVLVQAERADIAMGSTIELSRDGGKLKINSRDDTTLRICRSPGSPMPVSAEQGHIPIGLPSLLETGEDEHIGLLRQWLDNCNSHGCVPADPKDRYCPRRLLYLGKSPEDECCRLVNTNDLRHASEPVRYIALSHPWGDPDKHTHFKSLKSNIADHILGIDISSLPQNFRDAIAITRGLGLSYLWIDSICIRQATRDDQGHIIDEGDFLDEAGHMQDIFSSAYCVIAASSVSGMLDGFLNEREKGTSLALPPKKMENNCEAQFYVSNIVDDFERDVEKSLLSQRGWVYQERALARRTIYFTDKQTYFQCGRGIRCETLSKLKSDKAAFLGDHEFPEFGTSKTMGAQLFLFTRLYEDYSRLGFTHDWDKPVAIAGLEQRLTPKFGGNSGAGVFARSTSRWLLWERAGDVPNLKRIDFPPTTKKGKAPPSWSWMSCTGGIQFLEPPKGQTTWRKDIRLVLPGDKDTSWLYTKEDLSMEAPILEITVEASTRVAVSLSTVVPASQRANKDISLTLDAQKTPDGPPRHFIVIGTFGAETDPESRSYVLVVKYRVDLKAYERIGAGWIPERMVTAGRPVTTNGQTSTLWSIV